MALYQGYSKAFGRYEIKSTNEKGKVQGQARTFSGRAPGDADYKAHLAGTAGLGIIMLRDDDTCVFGALDYDKIGSDIVKAEQKVRTLGLPLVVCRSKSGGIHFYVFTSEPVPASMLRSRLADWAALLGIASQVEVFPKQSLRVSDVDVGNWINLPYFGVENTNRYAVIQGQPASFEEFLDYAECSQVSIEAFRAEAAPLQETRWFENGPPCLQHIAARGGFVEGERNTGMFSVIVYLKKRYPDTWEDYVDEYNQGLAQAKSGEVQQLIKNHRKKEYSYKCKESPCKEFCQRGACLSALYGVGEGASGSKAVDIGNVMRYEPQAPDEPMWALEINGRRVLVTNAQLYSRDAFNQQCMAQANQIAARMPPSRWLSYLAEEILPNATVVPLPEDTGPSAIVWAHIVAFFHQSARAMTWEQLSLGNPYVENGIVHFRAMDVIKYLDTRKVQHKGSQALYVFLRDKGAESFSKSINGATVRGWKMPLPEYVILPDTSDDITLNSEAF